LERFWSVFGAFGGLEDLGALRLGNIENFIFITKVTPW
jgi:hypothetical protein